MSTPLVITGIHTDIGKTVCAAVLARALQCDYWKPIQAGALDNSDSQHVQRWSGLPAEHIHAEAFRLSLAASPHIAAHAEGIDIELSDLAPPNATRPLLIETAGGVCSPINPRQVVADLLAHYHWPTVLVVRHYLGSISHTLSAIDALNARGVRILGLIVSGDAHADSEQFITEYSQLPILAHIPRLNPLSNEAIAAQAEPLRSALPSELIHWSLHGSFEPL